MDKCVKTSKIKIPHEIADMEVSYFMAISQHKIIEKMVFPVCNVFLFFSKSNKWWWKFFLAAPNNEFCCWFFQGGMRQHLLLPFIWETTIYTFILTIIIWEEWKKENKKLGCTAPGKKTATRTINGGCCRQQLMLSRDRKMWMDLVCLIHPLCLFTEFVMQVTLQQVTVEAAETFWDWGANITSSQPLHLSLEYQWCTDLFMCNTVHIRRYNVKSHWKVQGRNSTPE